MIYESGDDDTLSQKNNNLKDSVALCCQTNRANKNLLNRKLATIPKKRSYFKMNHWGYTDSLVVHKASIGLRKTVGLGDAPTNSQSDTDCAL